MAIDIGLPYNNEKRVKSGIKYAIMCAATNGHCAVLKENLISFCIELLNVTQEDIEESLIELKVKNDIVEEERIDANQKWIYLSSFYRAEQNVADRIKILNNAINMKKIDGLNKKIEKIEKHSKIELSDKQKEAIKCVNENNVCIITGGPGTRKNNNYKNNYRTI